ncbi:MAG: hypothetical protein RBS37_02750 [Bacteroidales bacterium]|jgi:hypothetical protein|nr:hypothetical protein [Bacteroidales bacterium]
MKKLSAFSAMIMASVFFLDAQQPVIVTDDSLMFGNSRLPALAVTIPEVSYETSLREWIKQLETGTKSKVVTENGEMSIFGAIIKNITENPVNVYSRFDNADTLLRLIVAFEPKKDQYIERSVFDLEYSRAREYLFNFSKTLYMGLVKEQLQAEENRLRTMQKELGSLEKNEARLGKTMRKSEKTLQTERERLIVYNNEMTSVSAAIIEHNNQLASMQAGDARDEKESYIKELEKNRKKVLKSVKKSENKISKAERAIKNAERALPKNDSTQGRTRDLISGQEAIVQQYADKLNTISSSVLR